MDSSVPSPPIARSLKMTPFPENVDFIQGDSISDETLAIVCRNWADFARQGNDRAARSATSRA
jgi:hypothetical protein